VATRAASPGGLAETSLGDANDVVHVAECEHQAGFAPTGCCRLGRSGSRSSSLAVN